MDVLLLGTAGALASMAFAPVLNASGALFLGILVTLVGATAILRVMDAVRNHRALSGPRTG